MFLWGGRSAHHVFQIYLMYLMLFSFDWMNCFPKCWIPYSLNGIHVTISVTHEDSQCDAWFFTLRILSVTHGFLRPGIYKEIYAQQFVSYDQFLPHLRNNVNSGLLQRYHCTMLTTVITLQLTQIHILL